MRLHPTVPFMPGEAPTSFASRLARRNNIASLRQLLGDLGLNFNKLVNGDHDTIISLAEIAGTEAAPLLRESCRREENGFMLRGQLLTRASLVWPSFRICPACIVEDQRLTEGPTETAAYCRTIWSVRHLRTCACHDVALIDLPTSSRVAAHDFTPAIDSWIGRGQAGIRDDRRRPISQFETYLFRRLEGTETDCWLDMLPFYAAARICEMMGVVATHGRTPAIKGLAADEWAGAGQQGFLIASAGPGRIEEFLRDLWTSYPGARASGAGPKAWFGRLYEWLEYENKDSAYDPIREAIVHFVAEHTPFHPNEKLFGRPIPYRKVYSVRTALTETGIGSVRLRKILFQANLIDSNHKLYADHEVIFDAVAAKALLSRCASALTSVDVASALGVCWSQVSLIAEAGYLQVIDERENTTAAPIFTFESYMDFVSKLRAGAEQVATVPDGACDLSAVRRRVQCTLLELVGLVMRRELTWVGWLQEASGFRSVLVNVDEVRNLLRREELDGYTRRQVEQYMGISNQVINKLIARGILRSKIQRHPATYSMVVIISKDEIESFCARYVKLAEVAKLLGQTIPASRRAIDDACIVPALADADFLTNFYLRSEIESLAAIRRERATTVTP